MDDQLTIDRYRGQLDDFLKNVQAYEAYLDGVKYDASQPVIEQQIAGMCTFEGTQSYMKRATETQGIPRRNFRRPILTDRKGPDEWPFLSTVGLGTYLGMPDDATDFDVYNAAKLLVLSGSVNVIDTAINYRCQKAERAIGAAVKTLVEKHGIDRSELFISTKNGYVPDDSDNGKSASMLIQELVEQEKVSFFIMKYHIISIWFVSSNFNFLKNINQITENDVAAGIHCMHPSFLEHQLQ